jgi:hypothetical protein
VTCDSYSPTPRRALPGNYKRGPTVQWQLLRAAILGLLVICYGTSCARTRYITQTVTVPVALLPALDTPPPSEPLKLGVHVVVGADGCPFPFSACLMPIDAVSLAVQIGNARALFRMQQAWMAMAWERCGAKPAEPSAGTNGELGRALRSGGAAPVAGRSSGGSGPPGSFGEP